MLHYGQEQTPPKGILNMRTAFALWAAALVFVPALVGLGLEDRSQLEKCEALGRSPEYCRLLVYGR